MGGSTGSSVIVLAPKAVFMVEETSHSNAHEILLWCFLWQQHQSGLLILFEISRLSLKFEQLSHFY